MKLECCAHCTDGEGRCVYPYYGAAPHDHDAAGPAIFFHPRDQWPPNFRPDPQSAECGTYTHCLHCGRGEQGASAEYLHSGAQSADRREPTDDH